MTNPEEYLENILKAAKQNHHELKVYKGEARSATLGRISCRHYVYTYRYKKCDALL